MVRLKQIQDKPKRNLVDQDAAKRFVASGLWNPGKSKDQYKDQESRPKKKTHHKNHQVTKQKENKDVEGIELSFKSDLKDN